MDARCASCCERRKRVPWKGTFINCSRKQKPKYEQSVASQTAKRMSFQYNNLCNLGRHRKICLSGIKLFARNSGPEIDLILWSQMFKAQVMKISFDQLTKIATFWRVSPFFHKSQFEVRFANCNECSFSYPQHCDGEAQIKILEGNNDKIRETVELKH